MLIPNRKSPLWLDPEWRTECLRDLMEEQGLTAAMVADILDCSELTVYGYRSIKARPITAWALKALVFEIRRESLV